MSVNQVDLTSNQYDEWSRYYDLSNNEIDSIVKKLGGAPWLGKRVLEIGCGTGRFTEKILADVAELVAVDIDDNRLSILKQKIKRNGFESKSEVFLGELYEVVRVLEGRQFDCILFTWSWRFIHQQGKSDRVFNTVKKLLAPSFAILSTMTVGGEWEDTIDLIVGTKESDREINLNKTANKNLVELFEKEKLEILDFLQVNHFKFPNISIATNFALEMSGVALSEKERVDMIVRKFINCDGIVQISDKIQCLFARSANWRMQK